MKRLAPHESDGLRDLETLGPSMNLFVRNRRPEVVDAEIERRNGNGFFQPDEHGGAARRVHEGRDRAAVKDAGHRITDEPFVVGKRQRNAPVLRFDEANAEGAIVRHVGGDALADARVEGIAFRVGAIRALLLRRVRRHRREAHIVPPGKRR